MKTKEEIIELNKKQTEFYNKDGKDRASNIATTIWRKIRGGSLNSFTKKYNLKDKVYDQHKIWLGDLSDKKVLDLGCFSGNALSLYIAERAKTYIGIDLSDVAIAKLNEKLDEANCPNSKALAIDFLSDAFEETDFDIIYAFGVMHHFENFDLLIKRINEKLIKGGKLITYDPLETSLPIVVLRKMYRPFQSDAEWEWPFSKKTLHKISDNFKVEEIKGILGKSKYGLPFQLIPLGADYKQKTIHGWVESDWNAKTVDDVLNCMHVTMYLSNTKD